MMRRLEKTDTVLIKEALSWSEGAPRWFRDADRAWGTITPDKYIEQMDDQADFGVFDGELVAVITLSLEGKGIFNSHLMVKRKAPVGLIVVSAVSIIRQLFENGMREGWAWPNKRNYGLRRILELIGMKRDGLEIIKGQSHGRPLTWVRYSCR